MSAAVSRIPSIADMLRAIWPRNAAKHAAQAAEMSCRTTQKWMSGENCPSAHTLLRLAERNKEVRAELMRLLEEIEIAEQNLADRKTLARERGAPAGNKVGALHPEGRRERNPVAGPSGRVARTAPRPTHALRHAS